MLPHLMRNVFVEDEIRVKRHSMERRNEICGVRGKWLNNQRRLYKGSDGHSMERRNEICGARGKWLNSQRRLYKGSDGHSMERRNEICGARGKWLNCQRRLYKGHVRLSMEGWKKKKDCGGVTEKKAKMDEFSVDHSLRLLLHRGTW